MERVAAPIVFGHEPFVGFGDSAHASRILEAVHGSAATSIRVIKQRIQGLELGVFVRRFVNDNFEDSPAFDHPLQTLLDNPTLQPDGSVTHTPSQLWGMVVTQYEAIGESYIAIIIDPATGVPINLQIMPPGTLEPLIENGRISGYRVVGSSSTQHLRTTDVVRIWEPDPEELYSPKGVMSKNAALINMDHFAVQHWEQFYKNDATPKLAFESNDGSEQFPTQDQQKEVSLSWIRRLNRRVGQFMGAPAFVKPGWKIHELSSQNEATAGVAMMTHTRSTVFEAFGVSPSLVGKNVDVNRAAAETARFTFDQNTVEPITLAIAEALTAQLASHYPQPTEGVQLIVKYRPFIARDKEFELRRDDADLKNWTRTVDEVRASREPELPGSSWGALPAAPMGIQPYTGDVVADIDLSGFGLEEPAEEEELAEGEVEVTVVPEEEERSRAAATLRQAREHFSAENEWQRVLARDVKWTPRFEARQRAVFKRQAEITVSRYIDLQGKRAAEDDIAAAVFPVDGWQDMFRRVIDPVRTGSFKDSADAAVAGINGRSFVLTQKARAIVLAQNRFHYIAVNTSSQSMIARILAASFDNGESGQQTAARIAREVFGVEAGATDIDSKVNRRRARTIAQTEIASAVQAAQVEGYKQTGVVERKMWNTSLDHLVRDTHTIEGQTVGLDDDFDVGGEPAAFIADERLSPGNRINCRCFVTPVFFDEDALGILGG